MTLSIYLRCVVPLLEYLVRLNITVCIFVGSGNIEIPVLCMLLSGEASMFEVPLNL